MLCGHTSISRNYSRACILMKHRYHNISAFHRLITTIATKGGLDERAQTRMNHLGLVLSAERRLRLQDSAQEKTLKLLTENLKSQPLVNITGDNLDIYVKHQTWELTEETKISIFLHKMFYLVE